MANKDNRAKYKDRAYVAPAFRLKCCLEQLMILSDYFSTFTWHLVPPAEIQQVLYTQGCGYQEAPFFGKISFRISAFNFQWISLKFSTNIL